MARPEKEIHWESVERMMEAGNSARSIYTHFRMDKDTFYDRFKKEYGKNFSDYSDALDEDGKSNIRLMQYTKAVQGNIQMLIWLGKVRLGQREPEPAQAVPPAQIEIDKDHMIMELQHKLALT